MSIQFSIRKIHTTNMDKETIISIIFYIVVNNVWYVVDVVFLTIRRVIGDK